MKSLKNLTIIGTSHIASQSIKEVEESILTIKPTIIAIELDPARLHALMAKKRRLHLSDIRSIGIKGFFFNLIGGYVERKLGKLVGVSPGSEMKKAIELAKQTNAKLALIDQDISITLKKLSKRITWKEKGRFLYDFIASFFVKQKINFDLTKVPEKKIIDKLTSKLKKKYPSIYLTLIEERNNIMAQNLYNIMQLHKEEPIVAVVGAGHEDTIIDLIKHEYRIHQTRN